MKSKSLIFLAVSALLLSFTYNASAQYMTEDLLLFKIGYVPVSPVTFDEGATVNGAEDTTYKIDDIESKGIAIQGEYNLIYGNFWFSFGLEYQKQFADAFDISYTDATTSLPVTNEAKKFSNDFIIPMISAKFATEGGFYVGAGLSGKYLMSTDKVTISEGEFDKKIDLWANGILGYHVPVAEGIFLDVEGRFGYNITNKQFEKMETATNSYEFKPKNAYDVAFYVGVGVRPRGSLY